jgi:hypothetical protein
MGFARVKGRYFVIDLIEHVRLVNIRHDQIGKAHLSACQRVDVHPFANFKQALTQTALSGPKNAERWFEVDAAAALSGSSTNSNVAECRGVVAEASPNIE